MPYVHHECWKWYHIQLLVREKSTYMICDSFCYAIGHLEPVLLSMYEQKDLLTWFNITLFLSSHYWLCTAHLTSFTLAKAHVMGMWLPSLRGNMYADAHSWAMSTVLGTGKNWSSRPTLTEYIYSHMYMGLSYGCLAGSIQYLYVMPLAWETIYSSTHLW